MAPAVKAEVKRAGLYYVSDTRGGIRRKRVGKQFHYLDARNHPIRAERHLKRIRSLVIPPAWTEVWICSRENGHLQAFGRDARGRKQYRYHAQWRAVRDDTKFSRTIAFGKALPRIRRRVQRDLRRRGLCKEKVLAAMVRLLESTLIRIGNEEYAQQNHSFGLSTMRDRHVRVERGEIHFSFRGKSGKQHAVDLRDKTLAPLVRKIQDLPGQVLFQYLDGEGKRHRVTSTDVNAYVRGIAGAEFSAKDFRTWAGTVLAAIALREFEQFDNQAQAKRNVVAAIEHVAKLLGNTPAICRKCYVHPVILSSYLDGHTVQVLQAKAELVLRRRLSSLRPAEAAVLAFLQTRLRRHPKKP